MASHGSVELSHVYRGDVFLIHLFAANSSRLSDRAIHNWYPIVDDFVRFGRERDF